MSRDVYEVKPHIRERARLRSMEDYQRQYRRSLEDPAAFWAEQAQRLTWFHPWHTVFDADYEEVARTLGKSEAACRQLVHRAKAQVLEARPRFQVSRETHQRLLRAFADAAARGSLQDLKALMAEDVELIALQSSLGGDGQSVTIVLIAQP